MCGREGGGGRRYQASTTIGLNAMNQTESSKIMNGRDKTWKCEHEQEQRAR